MQVSIFLNRMNIKDVISIANNAVNPADADKLKTAIYELQEKNLDLQHLRKMENLRFGFISSYL